MICLSCQDGMHDLCANTHRAAGEVEIEGSVVYVPGRLLVRRDEPATTWCDCAHEDSMMSTQTAEGTKRTHYHGMTYDHVTGTISGAPR